MPQLGLGTWELTGAQCEEVVATAIGLGYRHIDTAGAYANHREVGAGISHAGVPRDQLYVTTKIPLGKQTRSQVLSQADAFLKQLNLEYVDLLLIHWPNRHVPFAETLGAMAELVKKEVVRSVGISNFNARIMAEAVESSPVPVVTNQVEFHPLLYQRDLLATCRDLNMVLTAYAPLARGHVLRNTTLQEIAAAHNVTAAEVSIAWILAKDAVAIPKASSREHLQANLKAADLVLSGQDISRIDALAANQRLVDGPWKHYDW
jgi:2,5-diketo-D-gluconate reductase B